MPDLNERLSGIDRLTPPDLWSAARAKAEGREAVATHPSGWRRAVLIAASLVVGLGAVAWVTIAVRTTSSPPPSAAQPVLAPAPRTDCPIGFPRSSSVDTSVFVSQMKGYLPTWMPEGFGLLRSFGPEQAADGFGGYGIWSDDTCREVELTFNPNWVARDSSSVDPNASVGPWVVDMDVPGGCGNAILGKAGCLGYSAATPDGFLSLLMMGVDRDEGDRIALSIYSADGTQTPAATLALRASAYPISAPARDLAAAGGWVWAAGSRTKTVEKIDPSTGDVVATIPVFGEPAWIAGGANEVWVGLGGTEITAVVGIDTATNQTILTVHGVTGPLVQTSEGLWGFEYRSPEPNWMVLLDPHTGDVIRHVEIGPQPMDIAASGDSVWTLEMQTGTVRLIGPTDQARVVTDRSSGTFLAPDASGVYLGAWRQNSANDQNGPGTSAFASLDGRVQPVGDIYNFRPMVVADDRVWFIAGPHDGDLSGLCGMRTGDGVVDECADISIGLEGVHRPVTFDPGTRTLWAISDDGWKLYEVGIG